MKILIFTFGSRGDVQPYVALGEALKKAGHTVVLSTGQGFDAMIVGQGLIPATLSIDFKAILARPDMAEAMRSFSGKVRAWRTFRRTFQEHYREMWAVAQQVRPDMILAHPKGFAATHIAEALGVVCVPTTLQPAFTPTAEFPNFLLSANSLGAFGNRLSHQAFQRLADWGQASSLGAWPRDALGLKPDRPRTFFDGYHPRGKTVPRLHGYSRHIIPKPADWSEADRITGYWFSEPDTAWRPPDALRAFIEDGAPPVYVGFGSMPSEDAERQTRIVVDALRLAGRRGILASGWGGLAERAASRTVFSLESAPHDWLFPRCSAVVHHGGAGTTHEGLRWGRATIVCPLTVDQPFWGARVHGLGAGPKPIPQKALNSAALAGALMQAHDAVVVRRAAELGDQLRWEGGVAAAVAVLSTIEPG